MKSAIGLTIFFGAIAMFLWDGAPRLMSDVLHTRDFVPAQGHRITDYKCTNWNGVMFNDCTVTFVSQQSREPRQITDWRFGRAPEGPVQLLQRRDDPSSVTTDVSLQTLWNRVSMAVALVLFSIFLAIAHIVKALKAEDAPIDVPIDAPGGEPALQPAFQPVFQPMLQPLGRSTFGKRCA